MPEKYYLYLRTVSELDLEIIHSWRIKPEVFTLYDNVKVPSSWVETLNWWYSLSKTFVFVVMMTDEENPPVYWRGRRIGIMWMRFDEELPRIGGYIGDTTLNVAEVTVQAIQLILEAVRRSRGHEQVVMNVNWENKELLSRLGQKGWVVGQELGDNMLEMIYNKRK
jgi:hypothetical protein